ncbi:MAG: 7-cyano-7-deazaguanine synthase QueC [Hyphomicrobium sp.]
MDDTAALVLFSGGQDSAVCLALALERFAHVETTGFAYGQRHGVELETRQTFLQKLRAAFPRWADRLGEDHVLELPTLGRISETSLTRTTAIEIGEAGLPNTFVPGRNLLFFTYAAALAWRRGISTLVGGMCETDYSGYPDCRNDTLQTLAKALSLGLDKHITIETPLMYVDKAGTWAMAEKLGGQPLVELIIEETHTCYMGDRRKRHTWGYGCGTCPACELRAKGWEQWRHANTSDMRDAR